MAPFLFHCPPIEPRTRNVLSHQAPCNGPDRLTISLSVDVPLKRLKELLLRICDIHYAHVAYAPQVLVINSEVIENPHVSHFSFSNGPGRSHSPSHFFSPTNNQKVTLSPATPSLTGLSPCLNYELIHFRATIVAALFTNANKRFDSFIYTAYLSEQRAAISKCKPNENNASHRV